MKFHDESTDPVENTGGPVEGGAYTRAALDYLAAGWPVVPVGTDKKLLVSGRTGNTGMDADADQVGQEARSFTRANLALRMPPGVVGLDVDAYGGKHGDVTISLLETELGPLPDTCVSSARSWPSGIRFYRIPEGLKLPGELMAKDESGTYGTVGQLFKGVDVVQRHHRYAIVWPSVHQGVGAIYTWSCDGIPDPATLPELPQAWLDHFASPLGAPGEMSDAPGEDIDSWWDSISAGEPSEQLLSVIPDDAAPGQRHDAMCRAQTIIISMALEGEPGAAAAERMLWSWWQRVMTDRPPHREYMEAWGTGLRKGHARYLKMLANSLPVPDDWKSARSPRASRQKTGESRADQDGTDGEPDVPWWTGPAPDGIDVVDPWRSRAELTSLRQAGRSRLTGAHAILGVALTDVLARVPYFVTLPATVGGRQPLNLFCSVVGGSGKGKGKALAVARDWLAISGDEIYTGKLGTGQGITAEYKRMEHEDPDDQSTPKVMRQYRHAVIFENSEVDGLTAHAGMTGSNLLSELKCAYSGEMLGNSYADQEKRRLIPKLNYRLCVIMGVQPKNARGIFDDTDGGTPQRFVWVRMRDDDDQEHREAVKREGEAALPEWPGQWTLTLPEVLDPRGTPSDGTLYGEQLLARPSTPPGGKREPWEYVDVALSPRAHRDTIALHMASYCDDDDMTSALNSHGNLTRLRVAVAFAWLNGRADMNDADWWLSGWFMHRSDSVRDEVCKILRKEDQDAAERAIKFKAREAVVVQDAQHDKAVTRVAARFLRELATGEKTRTDLRRVLPSRDKQFIDEALERLIGAGEVRKTERGYTGR